MYYWDSKIVCVLLVASKLAPYKPHLSKTYINEVLLRVNSEQNTCYMLAGRRSGTKKVVWFGHDWQKFLQNEFLLSFFSFNVHSKYIQFSSCKNCCIHIKYLFGLFQKNFYFTIKINNNATAFQTRKYNVASIFLCFYFYYLLHKSFFQRNLRFTNL